VSSSEVDVLPNISPTDPKKPSQRASNIENIARDIRRVMRAQRLARAFIDFACALLRYAMRGEKARVTASPNDAQPCHSVESHERIFASRHNFLLTHFFSVQEFV
jgi:hypothetical protein